MIFYITLHQTAQKCITWYNTKTKSFLYNEQELVIKTVISTSANTSNSIHVYETEIGSKWKYFIYIYKIYRSENIFKSPFIYSGTESLLPVFIFVRSVGVVDIDLSECFLLMWLGIFSSAGCPHHLPRSVSRYVQIGMFFTLVGSELFLSYTPSFIRETSPLVHADAMMYVPDI
jgi:hypothetical protein